MLVIKNLKESKELDLIAMRAMYGGGLGFFKKAGKRALRTRADELLATFLKLNMKDPNNNATTHKRLRRLSRRFGF